MWFRLGYWWIDNCLKGYTWLKYLNMVLNHIFICTEKKTCQNHFDCFLNWMCQSFSPKHGETTVNWNSVLVKHCPPLDREWHYVEDAVTLIVWLHWISRTLGVSLWAQNICKPWNLKLCWPFIIDLRSYDYVMSMSFIHSVLTVNVQLSLLIKEHQKSPQLTAALKLDR
jgi:hypothetical protein